jgi:hypothetical protein
MPTTHKVFISYHHGLDAEYKNALVNWNEQHDIFLDGSVEIGEIADSLSDDAVRRIIRDDYLRDSTITVVLVGLETKNRKHVDWEIYSSMYNGAVSKQSGILVLTLPSTRCSYFTAAHGNEEKRLIFPDNTSWVDVTSRGDYESRYPHMPDRIIDNLLAPNVKISVVEWDRATRDPAVFRYLLEATFRDRAECDYDLSRPMRRSNG